MKSKEQFEFKVFGQYKDPAICFKLKEKEVMVFPIPLFESLCECNQKESINSTVSRDVSLSRNKSFFCGLCNVQKITSAFFQKKF